MILSKANGLESITYISGNTLTFSAAGISHSSGRSIAFVRDSQGRIAKITDPNGASLFYGYDANGDLRTFTDAMGNLTKLAYNRTHGL